MILMNIQDYITNRNLIKQFLDINLQQCCNPNEIEVFWNQLPGVTPKKAYEIREIYTCLIIQGLFQLNQLIGRKRNQNRTLISTFNRRTVHHIIHSSKMNYRYTQLIGTALQMIEYLIINQELTRIIKFDCVLGNMSKNEFTTLINHIYYFELACLIRNGELFSISFPLTHTLTQEQISYMLKDPFIDQMLSMVQHKQVKRRNCCAYIQALVEITQNTEFYNVELN